MISSLWLLIGLEFITEHFIYIDDLIISQEKKNHLCEWALENLELEIGPIAVRSMQHDWNGDPVHVLHLARIGQMELNKLSGEFLDVGDY